MWPLSDLSDRLPIGGSAPRRIVALRSPCAVHRGKPCSLDNVYDNVIFVVCRQPVAAVALAVTGLSVPDANRLLMLRIADERRLPLDAGRGERFASVDAIFADLNSRADPGPREGLPARFETRRET